MLAAVITAFGGPAVFALGEVAEPASGPAAELVEVTLAGVNHADLSCRRGDGPDRPPLPAVLGADVVGVRRSDGRRVAALLPGGGGYAQVAAPLRRYTVNVPDQIADEQALAVLGQGLTAWHCLHTLGRVTGDDVVVVTSGAGGAGHLAVQLARAAGARVVALALSPAGRAFAGTLGAHATVDSNHPELGTAVREALEAAPTLVLDGTGGRAFEQLHGALAPFGRVVAYGGAAGAPATVPLDSLIAGAIGVLGFRLQRVLDDEELYRTSAARLFHLAARGVLCARIGGRYPLGAVSRAHADLESHTATGKLVVDVRKLT